MSSIEKRKLNDSETELFSIELTKLGNQLAKKEGYKNPGLKDISAMHYYIIHKHNWLPAQIRNLGIDDIVLLLAEEIFSFGIEF